MEYVVIEQPTSEPVTLADAKQHLRTITGDTSEDDAIIKPIITAAREYCEEYTGLALARQTICAYPMDTQGRIYLPRTPIVDVKSVTLDGVAAKYTVDKARGYVVMDGTQSGDVAITYDAGADKVPMLMRQAMLLLIGHWYTNREAVIVGSLASFEVSLTANAILNKYRVWWF